MILFCNCAASGETVLCKLSITLIIWTIIIFPRVGEEHNNVMVVSGCPAQRKQSNEIRQHNSIKLKRTYLHGEQPLVVGLVAACGGRIGKVLFKTL